MLTRCAQADANIPQAHQAYVEACRAPSPKAEHSWSHPAVYEAGRRSDWFFLATTPEQFAFPVFKRNYEDAIRESSNGQTFDLPSLPESKSPEKSQAVTKSEGLKQIKGLKKALDF